jgi:DNA-binding transcriptional MerR regulator
MRMKQLSAEAGVPKGTIQFYIQEGLVPPPMKTHPNMAYYNHTHLNAIRLVRELQAKRFLPLSVIKRVMDAGIEHLSIDEMRTLVELDGKLFQNLKESPPVKPVTENALSGRTGVSPEEIRGLEQIGVLHPVRKGRHEYFEEDDIRLVECWARLRKAGFNEALGFGPSILKVHMELLDLLVREEARILTSRVTGKIPLQELSSMVEEATAILNTIIGVLHKKLILRTVKTFTDEFQAKMMSHD